MNSIDINLEKNLYSLGNIDWMESVYRYKSGKRFVHKTIGR